MMNDIEKDEGNRYLNASFTLAGYLLEAESEEAVIMAAMRVSDEVLGTIASIFVPFNEWEQSVPVLKFGNEKFLRTTNWQARLAKPSTRHACRSCDSRQAELGCPMLQDVSEAKNVYCIGLKCEGREIGVVSYYFSSVPNFSNAQKLFQRELVRLTDLTLSSLRLKALESEAVRRDFPSDEVKSKLCSLDEQNKRLLEQLEYKAILEERTRLARELHDGLAQTLAFLKVEAARLQNYISKGDEYTVNQTLEACHRTLADAYLDTRQAIDNLNRTPDMPLKEWLFATANDFKAATGQHVDVVLHGLDRTYSPSVKVQLTRIVQEALTNVRKHAEACSVKISAVQTGNNLTLEIIDSGHGFSPEQIPQPSHYGLRTMRERAGLIGADFQITSKEGEGTTVSLRIPVEEKPLQ